MFERAVYIKADYSVNKGFIFWITVILTASLLIAGRMAVENYWQDRHVAVVPGYSLPFGWAATSDGSRVLCREPTSYQAPAGFPLTDRRNDCPYFNQNLIAKGLNGMTPILLAVAVGIMSKGLHKKLTEAS